MPRLIEGQLSLFGEPPVKHCRGCRRRLIERQSIERGYGRTCWRKLSQQPKPNRKP